MNPKQTLRKRNIYLNKLIAFKDTEPVKVITGIRRCGKSSLLKLMVEHLKENGISASNIIEMNFESHDFKDMTADELYHYVKDRAIEGERIYLFFDEVQRIDKWEDTVQPIIGDCDVILYPHGSDIAGVEQYSFDNAKFAALYEDGYRYFFNVDSAVAWTQITEHSYRGGRRNIDGIRMIKDPEMLDDLFDVASVIDPARPELHYG